MMITYYSVSEQLCLLSRARLVIYRFSLVYLGNRFIRGDDMSLSGDTVIDSHAEILARRGLQRYDRQTEWQRKLHNQSQIPKCHENLTVIVL